MEYKYLNSQKQRVEWWLPGTGLGVGGRWANGEVMVKGYKVSVTQDK